MQQTIDAWLDSWTTKAKEKDVSLHAPGMGNGLLARFLDEAQQLGALSIQFKYPEVKGYTFVQLDPRPNAENPSFDYGIEVTVPALLSGQRNLDHHGTDATASTDSAAEQAGNMPASELPQDGAVLATVRADGDSVTAMAVLQSRLSGRPIDYEVIEAVGRFDRYGMVRGRTPEATERNNRWVIAIGRVATDFKRQLADRVKFVQSVLDGSVDPSEIDKLVEERNAEFAAAMQASKVEMAANDKIAVVVSTHRFATNIGYERARVVVATNPKMPVMVNGKPAETGETYLKHTICQYNEFVGLPMDKILADLNAVDPGWGGRGTIAGSPQNVDSKLTTEQVVEIVAKHLSV